MEANHLKHAHNPHTLLRLLCAGATDAYAHSGHYM